MRPSRQYSRTHVGTGNSLSQSGMPGPAYNPVRVYHRQRAIKDGFHRLSYCLETAATAAKGKTKLRGNFVIAIYPNAGGKSCARSSWGSTAKEPAWE